MTDDHHNQPPDRWLESKPDVSDDHACPAPGCACRSCTVRFHGDILRRLAGASKPGGNGYEAATSGRKGNMTTEEIFQHLAEMGIRPEQAADGVRRAHPAGGRALGSSWSRIPVSTPPTCDLCDEKATWRHPAGGLRCGKCPRPTR